ncbi:hypothetical protein AOLI_G00032390 [Acnodon oligacanthus]
MSMSPVTTAIVLVLPQCLEWPAGQRRQADLAATVSDLGGSSESSHRLLQDLPAPIGLSMPLRRDLLYLALEAPFYTDHALRSARERVLLHFNAFCSQTPITVPPCGHERSAASSGVLSAPLRAGSEPLPRLRPAAGRRASRASDTAPVYRESTCARAILLEPNTKDDAVRQTRSANPVKPRLINPAVCRPAAQRARGSRSGACCCLCLPHLSSVRPLDCATHRCGLSCLSGLFSSSSPPLCASLSPLSALSAAGATRSLPGMNARMLERDKREKRRDRANRPLLLETEKAPRCTVRLPHVHFTLTVSAVCASDASARRLGAAAAEGPCFHWVNQRERETEREGGGPVAPPAAPLQSCRSYLTLQFS